LCSGEVEGEGCAAAGRFVDGDDPAHGLDEVLADREAEPPARRGVGLAGAADEGIEEGIGDLFGDTGAVIGD